jgi:predicted GIY-YIG superfamily endonuclease
MKNTPKVKKEQIKPQNVQRPQDDKRKRPNKSLTPLKKQKIHTKPILNHTVLWEKLKQLKHPNAKTIEKSLDDKFPWGFDAQNPPKGFRANVIERLIDCKKRNPTHIVLVKSGNFFCTYGIDAVLCVEYANLNPMSMGCRVGAPVKTIQTYLNMLLSIGLEIILIEKDECCTVINCFNSTYYPPTANTICVDDVNATPPRIAIVIQHDCLNIYVIDSISNTIDMYENVPLQSFETIVQLHWDPNTICHIDAMGNTDQLIFSELSIKQLQWQCAPNIFIDEYIKRTIPTAPGVESSSMKFRHTIHSEVLKRCTIEQLGICTRNATVRGVPNLMKTIFPNVPNKCLSLMRKLFITPPKYKSRRLFQNLVQKYSELTTPLRSTPRFTASVSSCINLLRKRKATSTLLRKLMSMMLWVKELYKLPLGKELHSVVMTLSTFEVESFDQTILKLTNQSDLIGYWLGNSPETISSISTNDNLEQIMQESVEKWHGHISSKVISQNDINECRSQYLKNAREQAKHHVVWCEKLRQLASLHSDCGVHILKDYNGKQQKSNGKLLYSLWNVTEEYTNKCAQVQNRVNDIISQVNYDISESLILFVDLVWTIHRTILAHVEFGLQNSWCHAIVEETTSIEFLKLKPFWIPNGIENDIKLDKLIILTGANTGGKSTLCRATAAAALLAKTGLMVPAQYAKIPSNLGIFLRAGTADCAQNQLSGFASECIDIASLIHMTQNGPTLALVDEIASGTSSLEGSALAVAIIEELTKSKTIGFFSTHFDQMFTHAEIEKVPKMQMEMKSNLFTYKLINGVCQYRFATKIARENDIPECICQHADAIIQKDLKIQPPSTKADVPDVLDIAYQRLERRYDLVLRKGQCCPTITQSCVYLLDCPGGWYVGETDDLNTRFQKHLTTKKPRYMYAWKMKNKSESRHMETRLMDDLKRARTTLLSTKDGCHIHFGGN